MKKRLLCLLLCVCLLLSAAALFSSCAKRTVDFANGYTLIYASDASATMVAQIRSFASLLEEKTAGDIGLKKVKTDAELADEVKYEILVGNTNRPETERVLGKIKGHGYSIAVSGNKLVIVGTTNFLTSLALDHFIETYLSGEGGSSSFAVQKTVNQEMEMLELTSRWSFIYSSYLDGEKDYINVAIQNTKANITTFSDVRADSMAMLSDAEEASAEILAGIVDRTECREFLSSMDAIHYGVGAKNGRLMIGALGDTMMEKAFALFESILLDSVCVSEEGERRIFLPASFSRIYADTEKTDFVTDFPRPAGLALSGTVDVDNGSLAYYYEGDGVNADAYGAYCADLAAAGYTLYTDHTAEGSVFRTYINHAKGIMLYVAYNAYAHAEAQGTAHKKAIRIISASTENANMVGEAMLTRDLSYKKLQNSSITAVRLNYAYQVENNLDGRGELYVITLEDGSFILIDGGNANTVDRDRIYKVLLDLYKKGHNDQMPTASDPIRIAAWLVTHSHSDHYGAMESFIKTYCKNYGIYFVTIDALIANFASDEGYYNSTTGGKANTVVRDKMLEYSACVSDAPGKEAGFDYIKVHTGQKLWLANAELEILYTHEDLYPTRMHVYNDSSTVIRMNFYHTENGVISEGSKTSFLWLGDAQVTTDAQMRAMYGSYLQSDMVQVSHHGATGCTASLYQLVAPTCAWFPTSADAYDRYHDPAKAERSVSYQINYSISSVKYVIVSDFCNYTVSITESGADYKTEAQSPTGVFSAGDGNDVTIGIVMAKTDTGFLKTKHNAS